MFSKIKFAYKILSTNLGFSNPYQLNFSITYLCNSRCKFCNIWKLKPKNELTLKEMERFSKNIPFIQWLRLTGGEPFLRKDYVEIVKTFHKNLKDLYILTTPTNAVAPGFIYEKIKEVLEFFDKRYVITVSLDGDEKTHDKLRGIKGNWRNAINLYRELKILKKVHKNLDVFFGYTIYPGNVGLFKKTLESVRGFAAVNDFHFNLFETSDIYYHNYGVSKSEKYLRLARKEIDTILKMKGTALDPIGKIEKRYLKLGKKYLLNRRTPLSCNIMNLSCYVDPFGNVFPCTIFNEKLGNLRKNNYDLREILNSEKAKLIKEKTKKLQCPNCWTPCEAHQLIMSNWFSC